MNIFKPVSQVTVLNVFTVQQYLRFLKELNLVKECGYPLYFQKFGRANRLMFENSTYGVPVPRTLDTTFERDGRTWRVTVSTDTFIIATAVDAERDERGEVINDYDVIQVKL